jgi:hypothetical protein
VTQLYRMLDAPDASKAAIPCTFEEAKRFNTPELGWGVFCTLNTFNGARRKENLTRIEAWAVDMDEGDKLLQHARIESSPLIPSIVVETKRGFQVYWAAQEGAKPEHWNAIVLERLVPHFGADKNARDLCRILRMPGFLHLKDPASPFKCILRWKHLVRYSERQMADAFRWVPNVSEQRAAHQEKTRRIAPRASTVGESFWEFVYNIDCRDGLQRLSGHWACRGEQFTLRPCANGNWNVYVDGKSTSCFVDGNGRIGSLDNGGPTLYAWLLWYGNKPADCVAVLKEQYPQLAVIDEAERKAWRPA